jgi:hypothetical protein
MGSLFKYSQIERDFCRVLGCPAYRATLLFNMCTETDSPLICLCKSV